MATYYVDKINGNDTWTGLSSVYVSGTTGPWKTLSNPCNPAKVAHGSNHTINIIADTGPYLPADCQYLTLSYLYPAQNSAGFTVIWNWNNNLLQFDVNYNDGSYEWHQSTAVGKTTWYYLTAAGGANPSIAQVKTCVIDTYWNAAATNLTGSGGTSWAATHNWAWGDYDTLGFSTLYVKHPEGDPTGKSWKVMANATASYIIRTGYDGTTKYIFNNGIFTGGNGIIANVRTPWIFNRCIFVNADQDGISVTHAGGSGSESNYCKYINCGHRGISIDAAANITGYNNYFENVHLAVKLAANAAYTVTLRNNSSKNLLAGFIQHDNAAATLVESNNQIHLDPNSTHAGQAIAFTAGVRQWANTDATDLPPATATTATTGVDPSTFSNATQIFTSGVKVGKPLAGSPLLNAGADLSLTGDFDSVAPDATPNIGAYEGFASGSSGLSLGLGLSGGNRPPWWNRRRR